MYAIRSYYEAAVHTIVEEGPNDINRLIDLGINFDTDSEGHLKATMEGGHGRRRILHSGGDATGKEIVVITSYSIHYTKLYECR